jgi:hypothetical protein
MMIWWQRNLALRTPVYSVRLNSYIKQLKSLKYKLEAHIPVHKVTNNQMTKCTICFITPLCKKWWMKYYKI